MITIFSYIWASILRHITCEVKVRKIEALEKEHNVSLKDIIREFYLEKKNISIKDEFLPIWNVYKAIEAHSRLEDDVFAKWVEFRYENPGLVIETPYFEDSKEEEEKIYFVGKYEEVPKNIFFTYNEGTLVIDYENTYDEFANLNKDEQTEKLLTLLAKVYFKDAKDLNYTNGLEEIFDRDFAKTLKKHVNGKKTYNIVSLKENELKRMRKK